MRCSILWWSENAAIGWIWQINWRQMILANWRHFWIIVRSDEGYREHEMKAPVKFQWKTDTLSVAFGHWLFFSAHEAGLATLQVACDGYVISNSVIFEYKLPPREEQLLAPEPKVERSNDNLLKFTLLQRLEAMDDRLQIKQEPVDGSDLVRNSLAQNVFISLPISSRWKTRLFLPSPISKIDSWRIVSRWRHDCGGTVKSWVWRGLPVIEGWLCYI